MINDVMWIGTNVSNKLHASIFMVQDQASRLLRKVAIYIVSYNLSYR